MDSDPLPIIAIAGIGCETSTFSPARTQLNAFKILRGDAIITAEPFLRNDTTSSLRKAAQWHGILTASALPGGIVTNEAFETLTTEITTALQTLLSTTKRLDGLWFAIHGAMCVEGVEDSEATLLSRIRKVIGPETLVSASMDLHGNVSTELAHQCDLITCYRTAPHIDVYETRERAVIQLLRLLEKRKAALSEPNPRFIRPWKARVAIPILLPGEQTSTRLEPAKRIYAAVPGIEAQGDMIDAAIWVGYAWADEPRCHAVVVVTGWDQEKVARSAEKLARIVWDARREFCFVAPTGSLAESLDVAFKSPSRPYFISDSGDNPTAGGAGDVTWSLAELLKRPEISGSSSPEASKTVVYASIPGPTAVRTAVAAGIGAEVNVSVGAEVDSTHAGPVQLHGVVRAIKHGDKHARTEVVMQTGSLFVIVTELRKPYHLEADFTELGLKPRSGEIDVVVVKIGYLEPELYDMAKDWMLALTPGGVDQDLLRLGHRRISRPMWPFDSGDWSPDLSAQMVPPSDRPLE